MLFLEKCLFRSLKCPWGPFGLRYSSSPLFLFLQDYLFIYLFALHTIQYLFHLIHLFKPPLISTNCLIPVQWLCVTLFISFINSSEFVIIYLWNYFVYAFFFLLECKVCEDNEHICFHINLIHSECSMVCVTTLVFNNHFYFCIIN